MRLSSKGRQGLGCWWKLDRTQGGDLPPACARPCLAGRPLGCLCLGLWFKRKPQTGYKNFRVLRCTRERALAPARGFPRVQRLGRRSDLPTRKPSTAPKEGKGQGESSALEELTCASLLLEECACVREVHMHLPRSPDLLKPTTEPRWLRDRSMWCRKASPLGAAQRWGDPCPGGVFSSVLVRLRCRPFPYLVWTV